jgi:transcriptional regulator with XRE-family HTH domain
MQQRISTEQANAILNAVMLRLKLGSDRQLSGELGVKPPVISKLRNGHQALGPAVLIRLLEVSDVSLRELMGFANSASV